MKFNENYLIDIAEEDMSSEIRRAMNLGFGPPRSAHEGFAIIAEEMDELKAHVWMNQKKRNLEEMRKEAIQVAAMAVRFAAACQNGKWGRR